MQQRLSVQAKEFLESITYGVTFGTRRSNSSLLTCSSFRTRGSFFSRFALLTFVSCRASWSNRTHFSFKSGHTLHRTKVNKVILNQYIPFLLIKRYLNSLVIPRDLVRRGNLAIRMDQWDLACLGDQGVLVDLLYRHHPNVQAHQGHQEDLLHQVLQWDLPHPFDPVIQLLRELQSAHQHLVDPNWKGKTTGHSIR